MPLTGSDDALAEAIKSAMVSGGLKDDPQLDVMCSAIASAVLAHLIANTVVLPTALTAPSGGGPVVGTGTVS